MEEWEGKRRKRRGKKKGGGGGRKVEGKKRGERGGGRNRFVWPWGLQRSRGWAGLCITAGAQKT